MPQDEFDEDIKRYFKAEGRGPPNDERPTIDQATAFLALIKSNTSIYCDCANLVPHGDRALMRRHSTAGALAASGTYQPIEIYAPAPRCC